MEELVKLLDNKLEYLRHEVADEEIHIYVRGEKVEAICPYCGEASTQIHSRVKRTLKDLPIQRKGVSPLPLIMLWNIRFTIGAVSESIIQFWRSFGSCI